MDHRSTTASHDLTNHEVAAALEEVSLLLNAQADNPFRIAAYSAAAKTIRTLKRPVLAILDEQGAAGLRQLPGIGESIAGSIEQFVDSGRLEVQAGRSLLIEDRQ